MGGVRKKKSPQKIFAKIFEIKNWKLFLVVILLGFLAATQLRIDHLRMMDLKQAVFKADESQDDEKIAKALTDLRDFTSNHIVFNVIEENGNQKIIFGTGAFYLSNQYQRKANDALKVAQDKMLAEDPSMSAYGNVYKKVATVCDAIGKKKGWRYPNNDYLNCFWDELSKYPTTDQLSVSSAANLPSTELFRYDYNSPVWYPCLSGIIILIAAIIIFIMFIRILIWIATSIAILFIK